MIIQNNKKQFPFRKLLFVFVPLIVLGLGLKFYFSGGSKSNNTEIGCIAEKVVKENGQLMFKSGTHLFQGGETQSNEKSLSGVYSAKLNKSKPYGFTYELKNLKAGDVVEARIWYYTDGKKGDLIIDADWGAYKTSVPNGNSKGAWKELQVTLNVPPHVSNGMAKIYAYNPNATSIYFDDLFIEKRASSLELELQNKTKVEELKSINLVLGEKGLKKIELKRLKALQKGILESADDDWVKAKVEEGKVSQKAKVRLKGDWPDHLWGTKWSFRIKMAPGQAWNRLTTFSVQNPETRYFLHEWVFHKWLQQEGLLAPRYDFIQLKINGISKGIFAYEEHFEKQLPEFNERREGPIMKFSETGFWDAQEKMMGESNMGLLDGVPMFESSDIAAFGQNRIVKDSALFEQMKIAQKLMYAYKHGQKTIWDIFDVERVAKYYALMDLTKAYHGFIWHNQRMYFNPVISKLEPIAYDGYTQTGPFIWIKKPLIGYARNFRYMSAAYRGLMFERFFNDYDFVAKYVGYLVKYSNEEYVFNLLVNLESEIRKREELLQTEWPEYEYDRNFIHNEAKRVRLAIYPMPKTSIKAFHKGMNSSVYQIYNYHCLPVKLLGVGNSVEHIQPFETDTLLPPYSQKFPPEMIELKAGPTGKIIFFEVPGIDSVFQSPILPWEAPIGNTPEQELFSDLKISSNDIFSVDEVEKIVLFRPGTYQTDQDILIPPGYLVRFAAGVDLDLVRGAKFITKSQVMAYGREDEPIRIHSSDGTGKGFTMLQVPDGKRSEFKDVIFEGLTNMSHGGWAHTGAVSIYESEILFRNCRFVNNHSEDGLNIVRSVFSLNGCYVGNTPSDGFDADFCNGLVQDCRFFETGNDAMDFSGSHITVLSAYIEKAGDKAISFGEDSEGIVKFVDIKDCLIGIASKDLTHVNVEQANLSNVQQGFAIYQKKPEYGPATITVKNYNETEVEKLHVIQAGSELRIGDEVIKGKW